MFSILQENSFQSSMCEKSNHSISVIGKIAFIICLLKTFCNHSQKHINVTSHPCPTPINHSWYLGIRHNRLNRELVIKKKKKTENLVRFFNYGSASVIFTQKISANSRRGKIPFTAFSTKDKALWKNTLLGLTHDLKQTLLQFEFLISE